MLLCDIGNSAAKFYDDGMVFSVDLNDFMDYRTNQTIFYINVNDRVKNRLQENRRFVDLEPYFKFDTQYKGMGIDRIAACYNVDSGIVVDAGSAITIDVMLRNSHLGGFIMPGISSMLETYEKISPKLKIAFNSQVDMDCLPEKTSSAVSYGIIKPIILAIQEVSKDKKIFFTGGDGHYFVKFFSNTIYDKNLIFRSMLKVIKENKDIL